VVGVALGVGVIVALGEGVAASPPPQAASMARQPATSAEWAARVEKAKSRNTLPLRKSGAGYIRGARLGKRPVPWLHIVVEDAAKGANPSTDTQGASLANIEGAWHRLQEPQA